MAAQSDLNTLDSATIKLTSGSGRGLIEAGSGGILPYLDMDMVSILGFLVPEFSV